LQENTGKTVTNTMFYKVRFVNCIKFSILLQVVCGTRNVSLLTKIFY